jgi:heptosyltransferase-2
MPGKSILQKIINNLIYKFFALPENKNGLPAYPSEILVVRQHNQFGDLLASISIFRALKEKNPRCKVTLLTSPSNYYAVKKNKLIDKLFVFDKKKLFNPFYIFALFKLLNEKYDIAIVPSTVSISFTSNFLARISNSNIRIGPKTLNGIKNDFAFMFDKPVDLDWRKYPDAHVSDFGLDIVRPFNFNTKNFIPEITFDGYDKREADIFITSLHKGKKELLIGLHTGAGKPPNRWALTKFISLINNIHKNYNAKFYITGSYSDKAEIDYLKKNMQSEVSYCLNKEISVLAAIIAQSDLFITNDTGVMHVAGATDTPQISIFGPTNPFNWAPVGPSKYFIRKSDLIDDISVDDVYALCEFLLPQQIK